MTWNEEEKKSLFEWERGFEKEYVKPTLITVAVIWGVGFIGTFVSHYVESYNYLLPHFLVWPMVLSAFVIVIGLGAGGLDYINENGPRPRE